MFHRLINILLAVVAATGLVSLIRHQRVESSLRSERARLVKQFGFMEVENPSLFYLREVTQPETAHYVWRAHIPDDAELVLKSKHLTGSSSSWLQSRPEQVTLRFRFGMREGQPFFYQASDSGSSYGSMSMPPELGQYLWDHWDELDVEHAAVDDSIASDLSEPLTILSVSVPADMIETILKETSITREQYWNRLLSEPLFVLRCGTREAMEDQP